MTRNFWAYTVVDSCLHIGLYNNKWKMLGRPLLDKIAKDQNIELEVGQSALMSDAYNETYESVLKAVKAASDTNSKTNNKDYSKLSGNLFKGTSFEGMSVSEAFNQARGTNYNLARNGVRGTVNNRTYAYLENGEEKERKIGLTTRPELSDMLIKYL